MRRNVLTAVAVALLLAPMGIARPAIATTEGALDTSFGTSGIVRIDVNNGSTDELHAVAIDGSGRIVAVGTSGTDGVVLRLLSDGSPDPTFNGTSRVEVASMEIQDVAIDDSGRIIFVGTSGGDVRVVRLLPNGDEDTSFGSDGVVTTDLGATDEALAVALTPNGSIVVGGRSGSALAILRYTSAGALDASFESDGYATTAAGNFTSGSDAVARTIAVDSDGSIVVGGDVDGELVLIARYTESGDLDDHFVYGPGQAITTFRDLSILPDRRIITVGDYATSNGNGVIARFTTDLTLDPDFNGDGDKIIDFGANTSFTGVAVQQDGRIVITGSSSGANIVLDRFDPVGDSDPAFSPSGSFAFAGAPPTETASDIAVQPDGNIVVVGSENDGNGDTDLLVFRVFGTPIETPVVETLSEAGPSYDLSILTRPEAGTARLTRRDGTFVLPGNSNASGTVTYTHEELTATFAGTGATSAQGGLVGDGRGEVVVELTGDLTPDGVIEVWTASTPRLTAAHRITAAAADGEVQRFAVPLGAPLDGGGPIASGPHVLQLVLPTGIGRQVLDVNLDVRDGATGPVPTAIPAGSGPAGPASPFGAGLLTLALAGLVAVRAGRGSLRRPRAVRAGAR